MLINMKKPDELYLSAREASAELAISPATLYAYVSRGLIRSEPSPDSRSHRYRAEDVRGLKERRVPSPEPRGLRNVDPDQPVLDSAIATITENGPIYRGVNCVELAEKDTLEHTATLLWDVTGVDPFAADIIRRALVLLADHELNASTFTVRCAASTGLSLYDAIIAGLVALKGPRHGGAGVLASRLVKTLVDNDVAPVIRERVALGERFAGFGHGVYKRGDPRALSLLNALTRAGAPRKFTKEVPERIAEATGELVNIDYALAVMAHSLRLAPRSELTLFAMARAVGWIAHASEQLQNGGLIRPRARYVGPVPGRGGAIGAARES